jgi:transposase-like protein
MSKRYTPEHKMSVLALLDANGGSIALTAAQSGISERTLRAWKQERAQRQQYAQQLPPPNQRQQDESELPDGDEIVLMRNYIQKAALHMAAKLSAELESPVLYQKVSALNGLLDRLTKIENAFPKTRAPMVIRVERIPYPRRTDPAPSAGVDDDE